ncbi:MAG: type I DNA topoisomerase [Planctomycetota bacterium]|nr:type I DNA topoisomerase [Planctomycetota bacterium]
MPPAKRRLVIVESPAKAKKIGSFLGPGYKVMASYGHVRDLPSKAAEIPAAVKKEPWSTLGVNVDREFEPLYVIPPEKKKTVKDLKDALKDCDELLIATDEDREGESIGWHLIELLNPKVPVKRMVFDEITKDAILKAVENTRDLDTNLVAAQETRRVLDRLYGYTLSPLLWKKIARGLSAGRVQSVAVRILVQRELERLAFHSATYWDLKAGLTAGDKAEFDSDLATVGGKRVAAGRDFDENTGRLKPDVDVLLLNEAEATALRDRLKTVDWTVKSVETRDQKRTPYAPFTTSTLQQEANRKLGYSARQTMQVAQRLYEEGHITYMRTDSVSLSNEAITAARKTVQDRYGKDYLSPEPRRYQTKSKGAQEAHEAIRPSGTEMKTADELGLSGQEQKLYSLIWKRTVATQMAEARLKFQTVTIAADDAEFRATGRHVEFPGFFRAYVEGSDDPEAALDDTESALPPLKEGEKLALRVLNAASHETKPPARYTEASLVRRLEQEGIGRPSTYASIMGTIQDRGYVDKQGNQLVPTFTAIAVNRLLESYFPNLVDYGFTADMEQKLDDIASGQQDRKPYLDLFYRGEAGLERQVKTKEEEIDPRQACTLKLDSLSSDVRIGRFGPYFERESDGKRVTASIPHTIAPADLNDAIATKLIEDKERGPQAVGTDPETGVPIYVKAGPFGPYLQLGDVTEETPKPKRVGIPNNIDPTSITEEQALALISLPRRIGKHPESDKVVNVGIGRFGPYVLHDKKYGSFDRKTHTFEWEGKTYDVLNVTMPVAIEMLSRSKTRAAPTPLKDLGEHPEDKKPVQIFEGRYGPYVKYGKINATIPKDRDPQSVTLAEAVGWINEKAAKPAAGRKRAAKRASAK